MSIAYELQVNEDMINKLIAIEKAVAIFRLLVFEIYRCIDLLLQLQLHWQSVFIFF